MAYLQRRDRLPLRRQAMSERLPIVFTQEQIDQLAAKPFDVYDHELRARMSEYQTILDGISARTAARQATIEKYKLRTE